MRSLPYGMRYLALAYKPFAILLLHRQGGINASECKDTYEGP